MARNPLLIVIALALGFGFLVYALLSSSETEVSTEVDATVSTQEPAFETQLDTSKRHDGDEFVGFAVFPTWSATEPATFPVLIEGEAQAVWFENEEMLISIELPDGVVLGTGVAHAQFDQQEEGSLVVPFFAQLEKESDAEPFSGSAALVMRQGNASNNPERNAVFTTLIVIES